MDRGHHPAHAPYPDPWQGEPVGEAYAVDPHHDGSYSDIDVAPVYEGAEPVYEGAEPVYEGDGYEVSDAAYPSGAYDEAEAPLLVSPWLIHDLRAVPMMLDGHPAIELVLSLLRDYDRAGRACPQDGYDLLGWHNTVSVAVRTNRHGRWASFASGVGMFQPQPQGDSAAMDLGQHEHTAIWRFLPEVLGQFDVWAFVSINGVYVPFDDMMASNHYVDSNGAAKLSVVL